MSGYMPETIYLSEKSTHGTTTEPVRKANPPKYHSFEFCPYIADTDTIEKHIEEMHCTPIEPCFGCFDVEEHDRLTAPFIYDCPDCGADKELDQNEPVVFCPTIECLTDDVEMVPQH